MTRKINMFLTGLLFFITPWVAQGWNSTGHRMVALIAWEQLDAQAQAKVVKILKKHERFDKDFEDHMSEKIEMSDQATRDMWIFAHAATWPDIVRRFSGEDRDKYHHSYWHYINEPVFLSCDDKKYFQKDPDDPAAGYDIAVDLDKEWSSGMRLKELNIIQALIRSTTRMKRPTAPSREKAIDLCWIFHLVGDLHQPLHSTALFSERGFPTGDRGGNSIKLTTSSNLHSLWDSRAGTGKSLSLLSKRANSWIADQNLSTLGETASQDTNIENWLKESYDAAREFVYAEEILKAILEQEGELQGEGTLKNGTAKIPISQDYKEMAKILAKERVMQAGYRLAAVIEDVISN